jgi:maltose alpha-D-glucosyltransferase/alpha-amylase
MAQPGSTSDPLWYKDAVIYQVHVRSFCDSTSDGVGDFRGLTSKLPYIKSLGVSCVWLLPFYPSPLKDDGYDIGHYEGVHPSYGTLKDFRTFLRAAHEAGLQVITELVINHTSDQHPWFQAARRAPAGSSKRDYYVWSQDPQKYPGVRIIFTDTESSNWTWDPVAGAYYWHRFFHHQPDLNFDNPRVLRAVTKVMRFWMDQGVDGMRLDAVPYLIERDGTNCESLPETHAVLRHLRAELDRHYDGRLLLAEANQWPGDVRAYFGDGDECHMAFHFPLMPRIYMALKQEDRFPIVDVLTQTPDLPPSGQWAIFLRNHDELTLEMVTDEERDYLREAYAAEPQMRINGGIRRRLAPLLENDRNRIELLNSLLLSLPGTPVIYYGDEIGMGDNIYLGDRNSVRTPMQWSPDRNAGFSQADPQRLYAPLLMDPVYGYEVVNVEAQERAPSSLLNWMRRAIALRRRHRTFGRGTIRFLDPANQKVLAYIREHEDERILCVANLSRQAQPCELDLGRYRGRVPVEMFGGTEFPRIGELPYFVTLGPYASYWFLLREEVEAPPSARPVPRSSPKPIDALDLRPLLLGLDWSSAFDTATHEILERDYLPVHLATRRWFQAEGRSIRQVRIRDHVRMGDGLEPVFITLLDVGFDDGSVGTYCLPVGFLSGDAGDQLLRESPDLVIARVSGARKGVLHERLDLGPAARLLTAIELGHDVAGLRGRAVGVRLSDASTLVMRPEAGASRLNAEQRNTSFVFGDSAILKLIRRVESGPHPEVEAGLHFAQVGYVGAPPLLGVLEYRDAQNTPMTLALVHGLFRHNVSAWDQALGELSRFYDTAAPATMPLAPGAPEGTMQIGWYLDAARRIGLHTAEMHRALASPGDNPAFTPSALEPADVRRVAQQARALMPTLDSLLAALPDPASPRVSDAIASIRRALPRLGPWLDARSAAGAGGLAIRVHGDYHLGQLLVHEGGFKVVDFEGDADLPLADRRVRQSPLEDVAGMLRSLRSASWIALVAWLDQHPDPTSPLDGVAREWTAAVRQAFLDGYLQAVPDRFLPDEPARTALLHLSLVRRTLEDARDELMRRPSMAPAALLTLADELDEAGV